VAKTLNHNKLRQWQQRVRQFRASGCSGAEFCRRNQLALHNFFYWLRKIEDAGLDDGQLGSKSRKRVESDMARGQQVGLRTVNSKHVPELIERGSQTRSSTDFAPDLVQIAVGDGCAVSIPAQCHDTIRLVVGLVLGATERSSRSTSSFHPVIVR
jgi:hypothetical protein